MVPKDIVNNQKLDEKSIKFSTRAVSFVSDGYLGQLSSRAISNQNLNNQANNQHHLSKDKNMSENIVNDAPLGKPEYYYYPPELISDYKDFFNDKEIKEFKVVGRGLVNPGWNTCYLNSILQALTYAPFLSLDCLRKTHQSICKHKLENLVCLMCMFEDHVNLVFENKNVDTSTNKAIVPHFIKCAQKLIWKKFRIGVMQDAQEFLRFFLEALHKACLPKKLQNDEVFRRLNPITASTTYIGQLFCGFFRSRIICSNCKYISNTYDPFMDIPLDIMGVSNLENAFKLFTKTEYLRGDNRYKCPNCKQKSDASKQLLIEKLPPLLTIQLKRFSFVGHGTRKPNKAIDFSETLDMKPYMAYQDFSISHKYKLWAVVCHSGNTLSCGHYYTHAKSINNQWYCFNDEHVNPTTLNSVLNENYEAYLLFYYKIDFNKDYSQEQYSSDDIHQYNLAPEISFVNLDKNPTYKRNYRKNQMKQEFENFNDFLDNLSHNNKDQLTENSKFNSNTPDATQNNDIRLVFTSKTSVSRSSIDNSEFLTPLSDVSVESSTSSRRLSNIIKSPKSLTRNKKTGKSIFTFNDLNIISKTRRNFKNIIFYKKFSNLFYSEETCGKNSSNIFLNSSITNNSSFSNKSLENIDIFKNSNQIDKWDDLIITNRDEKLIQDFNQSLLPKSNVRSEYDKEYDKGKLKKPLRIAMKQGLESSNNKLTTSFKDSKKYLNGVALNHFTNKELFDIASRNKVNFKNNNKKRFIRVK